MDFKNVQQLLDEKEIEEVINTRLVKGTPDMSVENAIRAMQENASGYIVIAEDNKAVGIFTENDVIFKILERDVDWNQPVGDFMTPDPFVLRLGDSISKAIELMGEHKFYHIPLVSDKQELIGILSVRSLIRFLAGYYPAEVYNLPPNMDQIIETPEGG